MPQGVVVIEVFITQGQPHHSLLDQRLHRMLDLIRVPMIHETLGEALQHMCPLFDLSKQQSATVGADLPPVELSHHYTTPKLVKFQLPCRTRCFHKAALSFGSKRLISQRLCHEMRPYSIQSVRNPG